VGGLRQITGVISTDLAVSIATHHTLDCRGAASPKVEQSDYCGRKKGWDTSLWKLKQTCASKVKGIRREFRRMPEH